MVQEMVTLACRVTPPEEAWTTAVPEVFPGTFRVAVATPPTVELAGVMVPIELSQVTVVPLATARPRLSVTIALIWLELLQTVVVPSDSRIWNGSAEVQPTLKAIVEDVTLPVLAWIRI
jgi:hypothetical protein